jgi:S-adenosylmethionine hydrolase
LITLLLDRAEQAGKPVDIVHLDRPEYWLKEVSYVFHGRDIFAPVAAHLANGVPLARLGAPIHDPLRLDIPHPTRTPTGWDAQIIYIDSFGNLVTNLRREDLAQTADIRLRLKGHDIAGLVNTFGERPAGDLAILYGSTGSLIVSVVNGNAAQRLNARVGDPVEVAVLE